MISVTMQAVPMSHGLILAAILFLLGLAGLLVRRNLVFALLSLEVMLNAAGLAFIVGASRWGNVDGQVMFLLILTLAAAEVAVGLALVLQLFRRHGTVDLDVLSEMKG
ncbi:NADH-quinone oxidoreductase subunit K [Pseudohongiella nitratireducens]|uniref:NADH-quinone oxidoreductase subunit K n=2 Tax=Pseudohongiella nitratireducens TaxID=1768907 RepID=A0A916QM77_9GAMM|nr:NADH-quinone oxidoreductase subunit K [Pseudohongiella nitratireducens]